MNENLQRLSIQITKHQYNLLKYHTKPGVSISSLVRNALDDYFADAEEALREKYFEAAEYEEYEKYMIYCYTKCDSSKNPIATQEIGKMFGRVLPIFLCFVVK